VTVRVRSAVRFHEWRPKTAWHVPCNEQAVFSPLLSNGSSHAFHPEGFHPHRVDDRGCDHRHPGGGCAAGVPDYTVRAKLSEGIVGASALKQVITDGYTSDGMAGVTAAAGAINAQPNNSKYVGGIAANAATGVLTVTYIAATTGLPAAGTLLFTPGVKTGGAGVPAVALADGLQGAIEWACSSAANVKALTVVAGARRRQRAGPLRAERVPLSKGIKPPR
jgi:type IV pilus assembly protein PilA